MMHELTIAKNLIDLVCENAAKQKAERVTAIYIRLGELSSFNRALHFCFDRVTTGTICEGAKLHIETVPLTVYCDTCQCEKRPGGRYNFRCFDCGMPTPKVVAGREMQVSAIKLDFAPSAWTSDRLINSNCQSAVACFD